MLAALGSVAVGGAAAVSTGAFTSVEADRDVTVSVADDADAYLGLQSAGSANADAFVNNNGGTVSLDLSSSGNGGTGLNKNAETRIDDLLVVSNQGTQLVNVWVNLDLGNISGISDSSLYFYPGDTTGVRLNNGAGSESNDVLALTPGQSATLGLFADIGDISTVDQTVTAVINADVSRGDGGSSEPADNTGGDFATVSNDGTGDFDAQTDTNPLQTALKEVSGTTVAVKDTGTPIQVDEPLNVEKEGLRLIGFNGNPTVEYRGGYPGPALSITADNVSVDNIQFDFFGNSDDDSIANFSGGSSFVDTGDTNTTFRNSAFNVVVVEEDGSTPFDTRGGLSLGTTPAASFVGVDISLVNREANAPIAADSGRPGGFFVVGKEIRDCTLSGGPKIATFNAETATVVDNTVENVGSTEGIAVDSAARDVTVRGNSIEYDPELAGDDISAPFDGAEIRVEPPVGELTVNGETPDTGEDLAEAIGEANTGSKVEGGAVTVVRSTEPNSRFPDSGNSE
jgi:hypothetical protein